MRILLVNWNDRENPHAGGAAGNKGYEAVAAALTTADVLGQLTRAAPRD